MDVVILSDAGEVASRAARIVAELLREKPDAVLGLATGRTPRPVYAELVRLHRDEGLDLSAVTTFNLDEYVGIAPEHPHSFHRYMEEHLFAHVAVARRHIPNGLASDLDAQCNAYEEAIAHAGGIDLLLLGLGVHGHIAFNEPGCSLASRTRVSTLAESTRASYEAAAGAEAPRHAITMGVGTILEARRCLVVACGAKKAPAVAKMTEGPVTALVPASALQLHPSTTVLLDEEAARSLSLADYHRQVERHRSSRR